MVVATGIDGHRNTGKSVSTVVEAIKVVGLVDEVHVEGLLNVLQNLGTEIVTELVEGEGIVAGAHAVVVSRTIAYLRGLCLAAVGLPVYDSGKSVGAVRQVGMASSAKVCECVVGQLHAMLHENERLDFVVVNLTY